MGATLFGDKNSIIPANTFSTITALRAINSLLYSSVFVLGYYAAGDGGGGNYYLDASDTTSADNGGTIIVAADAGRWKLDLQGQTELSVLQFGCKGDNSFNDWPSIVATNTVAAAKGLTTYFPAPKIAYKCTPTPSSPINIATAWRGDSKYFTIINVDNTYAGEFARILPSASLEKLTIQTPGLTKTAGSIGVRISAANTKDQCVNPNFSDCFVRGFDKDIDVQNVYVMHANSIHCESSNIGINCTPDASGGLGFITTNTWFNCDFGNNAINVFYNSPNYSNTLTFICGNISGASGSVQCSLSKVRVVNFIQFYFEASPSIRALSLGDVDYVGISGAYINNTGGIQVGSGSATRLRTERVWCTTSTDIITGADGSQNFSAYDCSFPGAGNSVVTLWKTLDLRNTDYNNTRYAALTRGLSVGFYDNFQSGGGITTPDMNKGTNHRITVTDTTAFTVASPANAIAGQTLIVTVQNSSGGGALGAITWNAVFHLQAAWVSPASGFCRSMILVFDGGVWHEISRSTADVSN